MYFDLILILIYLVVIMGIGIWGRLRNEVGVDEYFLSSRSLKWPYIAVSTIATNIQANHFVAMAGSAYVFGLAQANLEINAVFGILLAAFVFVPIYLQMKVVTITQFFEKKLGARVALTYSVLMIFLYSFMYLGTALFWASYVLEGIFGNILSVFSDERAIRIAILIIFTGLFSAIYTYMGGLRAVVRTDVIQFVILVAGGFITLFIAVKHLGGWEQLWGKTGHLMHLHLPSDHDTLPWTGIIGMLLLNLNYWGANQVILQRALAAKSLRDAQIGLLVGGGLKYIMAIIIIIPGIALAGILREKSLADPDLAYITLVRDFLPDGLRGIILMGLFASLMSTLDSIYNSVSTLWSIDIYKKYIRPDATESEIVGAGKKSILAAFITGALFSFVVLYVKFDNPTFPLTHWFNQLSYFVKNGFVIIIMSAVFLLRPSRKLVLFTMLFSMPLTYLFMKFLPDMNYFIRSAWVILLSFGFIAAATFLKSGELFISNNMLVISDKYVGRLGILLALSLVFCHIIFH